MSWISKCSNLCGKCGSCFCQGSILEALLLLLLLLGCQVWAPSLARLLDMLRSWRNMFVQGGMWLLVGHLCSHWGKVFVAPSNNTRDEYGWLRGAGAFPFLVILVSLFLRISGMWVFLHNPHPAGFHGGRVSSFGFQLSFWRRRHGAAGFLRGEGSRGVGGSARARPRGGKA